MSSMPLLPGDAPYSIDYPTGNVEDVLRKNRLPGTAYLVVGELSLLAADGLAKCVSVIGDGVTSKV